MKVESNNFVALAQIAVKDPDLQEAVALGTYNGYSKRLVAMFSQGHEHGEAMRMQAAAIAAAPSKSRLTCWNWRKNR
ncbi:MAG: hypothetical protein U0694_02605 [Anaerolineae bacterium]